MGASGRLHPFLSSVTCRSRCVKCRPSYRTLLAHLAHIRAHAAGRDGDDCGADTALGRRVGVPPLSIIKATVEVVVLTCQQKQAAWGPLEHRGTCEGAMSTRDALPRAQVDNLQGPHG